MTRALVLVDIQNDFMPGGALAVNDGDAVVPVANRLVSAYDLVVATQDWHPADHGSFAANHPGKTPLDMIDLNGLDQVLWPTHCVQGTPGAELHPDLLRERVATVIRKGSDPAVDSYSGFFDNGRRQATGMEAWLRDRGVDAVDIMGLATDYCVKFTALDAVDLGFATRLLLPGCRAVDLAPGDADRAVEEMRRTGVAVVFDIADIADSGDSGDVGNAGDAGDHGNDR